MQDATTRDWAASPGPFEAPRTLTPTYLGRMAADGLAADEWYLEDLQKIGVGTALTEDEQRTWPERMRGIYVTKGEVSEADEVDVWASMLVERARRALELLDEYANGHPLQDQWKESASRLGQLSDAFLYRAGAWEAEDALNDMERDLASTH